MFKLIFGVLLAVFLSFVLKVIYKFDYHKTVWNHQPGKCHVVPGIDYGSEDMQTTSTGLAFITSGVNAIFFASSYKEYYKKENIKGRIYVFNMEKPNEGAKELAIVGGNIPESDFAPHGMSLVEENGKIILFVVLHRKDIDTIEKYEYISKEKKLRHLQSYNNSALVLLNDVVAIDSNSFYFTNYRSRNSFVHLSEMLFGLPYGSIVFFDGSKYVEAASGINMVNGIAVSRDNKHVYVASSGLNGGVYIYKRENDNMLTLVDKVPLKTTPDNPNVDTETGNLLLGCHPVKHEIKSNLEDPSKYPAPSQVLMLHMDESGSNVRRITELYSNDGHTLHGSTSAVLYKNRMLIGTVAHKMMYCEVNTL